MTLWLLSALLPFAAVLIGWSLWLKHQNRRSSKPVKDRLLRAPGETLHAKLDDLEVDLVSRFGVVAIASLPFAAIAPSLVKGIDVSVEIMVWLLIFSITVLRVVTLTRTFLNYRLGLGGERAVGEELNKLMLEGFHVFHDIPGKDTWNIDHALVGPSGVFVVETKTRRKRKAESADFYKITFNGRSLEFPNGTQDSLALQQAERNAAWLSDVLTKAQAEPIRVQPILTFPGWWIDRKEHS